MTNRKERSKYRKKYIRVEAHFVLLSKDCKTLQTFLSNPQGRFSQCTAKDQQISNKMQDLLCLYNMWVHLVLLCLQTMTCTSFQTLSHNCNNTTALERTPCLISLWNIQTQSSGKYSQTVYLRHQKHQLHLTVKLLAISSWGNPSLLVFTGGSQSKQHADHRNPEAAIGHMNSCDTHSDSVLGRADRNQVDRKPGTDSYRGSAGAAWSRRTDNPTCWNRWHRMIGRLQGRDGRKGNQWLSVTSKINFHFTRELQDCLSHFSPRCCSGKQRKMDVQLIKRKPSNSSNPVSDFPDRLAGVF